MLDCIRANGVSIILVVLIQGTGPFDFRNYWKLHEHIERMRAWVQLEQRYFKVACYIISKKSVVLCWKQCYL